MVNDLRKDPMYLDSAGSLISMRTGLHIIKLIQWVNPLAVGDRAYLIDASGNVICDFTCTVGGEGKEVFFGERGHPFDGPFNLAELTSGALLVSRF